MNCGALTVYLLCRLTFSDKDLNRAGHYNGRTSGDLLRLPLHQNRASRKMATRRRPSWRTTEMTMISVPRLGPKIAM